MNSPFDEIQAAGAIATALGVFLAVWQLWEAKKQARTEFEDQFAREYRELSKVIPLEAFFGEKLETKEIEQAKAAFFHYIDLCNEQVFLRQQGRISRATWQSWCGGIEANLKLPAFQLGWREIKQKTTTFAELRKLEESDFNEDPKDWGRKPVPFISTDCKDAKPPLDEAA
jgi:hypothetical protein